MNKWIKAANLGAMTGLRSTAGLRAAGRHYELGAYRSWFDRMLWVESACDKLPWMPARTQSVSLVGRGVLGGVAGSGVDRQGGRKERAYLGALAAVSALATTYAASRLRRRIARSGWWMNGVAGLLEDVIVAAVSRRAGIV